MKRKFEVYSRLNASCAWQLCKSFCSGVAASEYISRRLYFEAQHPVVCDYMVKVVKND